MRDLKFRVWNTDYQTDGLKAKMEIFNLKDLHKNNLPCNFSSKNVMQYTGLKDADGAVIYEGDILDNDWKVVWSDTSHLWGLQTKDGVVIGIYNYDMKDFQIIGNIYENPELSDQVNTGNQDSN